MWYAIVEFDADGVQQFDCIATAETLPAVLALVMQNEVFAATMQQTDRLVVQYRTEA